MPDPAVEILWLMEASLGPNEASSDQVVEKTLAGQVVARRLEQAPANVGRAVVKKVRAAVKLDRVLAIGEDQVSAMQPDQVLVICVEQVWAT